MPGTTKRILGLTRSVRFKIVLITLLVLVFTLSVSSFLMNRLFVKTCQDALLLEGTGVARNLRIQLERILSFEIKLHEIVGFEVQCDEAVAEQDLLHYALVADTRGNVIFHNATYRNGVSISLPGTDDPGYTDPFIGDVRIGDSRMWTLSFPATDHLGRMQACVQLAVPHGMLYQRIDPVRYRS